MDFDELQKSWREQPVPAVTDREAVQQGVLQQWRRQQRKALWANIGVTVAFAFTFCVFVWVYQSFREGRSIFFTGSISFVSVLMLVYLWVLWKSISFKKIDMAMPIGAYLDGFIAKLLWRKKLFTTYSWVYAILLWLGMMFYLADVSREGSMLFKVVAFGATTIYIFGMQVITRYTKNRKKINELEELIINLQLLKRNIHAE